MRGTRPPRPCTVRPARPTDVTAIAGLLAQLGYDSEVPQLAYRLFRLSHGAGTFARTPTRVLVAGRGRAVLGVACVTAVTRLGFDEPDAQLTELVVDEQARRQGVGRALLAAAERWAKRAGCRQLFVLSNRTRREAHAFYRAAGYGETHRVFKRGPRRKTP